MLDSVTDSDDLVLAAAVSDPAAFAAFYRRYERLVLGFFLKRTRDPEVAADLTAEVFAAALAACPRYRPGEAPASAWLFGIAHHKLAKSVRRRTVEDRARRRLSMAPVALTDEDLERVESVCGADESLVTLLAGLPADQREAIRARVLDEHSYDEVAVELRCSTATARKRVSRGLAHLRDQLGGRSV
jgi:RNA polymerase sigma-70 factor (ECF subfamily)